MSDSYTKAPETVIARMMAKLLGVSVADNVVDVASAYADETTNHEMAAWMEAVSGVYPWVTNVAKDVMSDKITPLVENLASYSGHVFVLKDTAFSGADSLWLAAGDPPSACIRAMAGMQHRGLTRAIKLPDGGLVHIIAIQLNSCEP